MITLLLVLSCRPPVPAPTMPVGAEVVRTLSSVIEDPPPYGAVVVIQPLRVISGRSGLDGAVVVQAPEDGRGLMVVPGGPLDGWPPPIGTDLRLRVVWAGTAISPLGFLRADADAVAVGAGSPLVAEPPDLVSWSLGRWREVRITSQPDPAGRADTTAGQLADRFRTGLPGVGSEGDLTGIVLDDGSVAPRSPADWSGSWVEASPSLTSIAAIKAGSFDDGALVQLQVVQATRWSSDGRWAVVQDELGDGLWVDAEGFGDGRGEVGQLSVWTGEVRRDAGRPYLRTWWPRDVLDQVPIVVTTSGDGAIVARTLTTLAPPDGLGERVADDGVILDDRFQPLSGLSAPVSVRAALIVVADRPLVLAVTEILP